MGALVIALYISANIAYVFQSITAVFQYLYLVHEIHGFVEP